MFDEPGISPDAPRHLDARRGAIDAENSTRRWISQPNENSICHSHTRYQRTNPPLCHCSRGRRRPRRMILSSIRRTIHSARVRRRRKTARVSAFVPVRRRDTCCQTPRGFRQLINDGIRLFDRFRYWGYGRTRDARRRRVLTRSSTNCRGRSTWCLGERTARGGV